MMNKSIQKSFGMVALTWIFVGCISGGCSSSPKDTQSNRYPAMSSARKGGSSDIWTNPNVPPRLPIIQPANYPKWTDDGATLTADTPAGCDPHVFIPQFARGDALDDYFSSNNDDRDASTQLRDYFNGHPIRFPSGKILLPVGVGKVKAIDGDHAARLEDLFLYEKKKSGSTEDSSADQFCTTYLNEGNKDAQDKFQWIFIPVADKGKTTNLARIEEASKVYNDAFNQVIARLLDCESKFNYYAFGCQSAFERTPTMLGMILKEAGCSTKNAVFIADMLLGRNDIPQETREAIVDKTPMIDSALQKKLQDMLWGTPDSGL